jgi:hypothetical protein
MFYCRECQLANGWPESGNKSYGDCENCDRLGTVCNDVPSGVLENWGTITNSLAHPETYVRRERPQRHPEIF